MPPPPPKRAPSWARTTITLATAIFAAVGSALALERHWGFERELGLDKAYFFQRVWQAAFMDEPLRTLLGTEQGYGLLAGRHVEPILVLAVPPVQVFPHAESLLVLQALLVALGGLALGQLALRRIRDPVSAVLATIAWLTVPGLLMVVVEDFRTLTLAIPFIIAGCAALLEGKLVPGLILALAAASCREEVALLLLPAIPAMAWPGKPRRRWASAVVLLAAVLAWLLFMRLGLGRVSDFFVSGDLWGGLAHAFGSTDDGGGWAWTYAEQLAEIGGPSLLLAAAAPLAALLVLGNWIGATATSGYVSSNAYHLWAVGLAGLGLVLVAATARMERWRWPWRAVLAAIIVGNLALLPPEMRGRALHSHHTLLGQTRPSQRSDTPWTVIHQVPPGVPVLADARYVAMLADRPVIYATDDWHEPADRAWITSAVEWALVPDFHDWVPLLHEAGFEDIARGGPALLLHRAEPAPSLGEARTPG